MREVAASRRRRAGRPSSAGSRAVEHVDDPRPRRGDLHRVDDEPLAGELLQGRGVVAVLEPVGDELRRRRRGSDRRARLGDDLHRGVDDGRIDLRRARAGCSSSRRHRARAPPPPRRRAAARPASHRGGASSGRPRGRRRTSGRSRRRAVRAVGTGWARSHTRVMTPSVPSEPMNSWLRSGPTAPAGLPPVRIDASRRRARPRARRPCPRSCRSECEYWPAPRHATQPPTVARSKLCGKWPTVRPCSARSSSSRSGPNVPAATSTTPDSTSTVADTVERGHVEHDTAEDRHRRPGHAAATAGRGDRDPRLVARGEDRCHLRRGRRSDDRGGRDGTCRRATSAAPAATSRDSPRRPASMSVIVSQIDASRSSSDGGSGATSPASRWPVPVSSIGGVGVVIAARATSVRSRMAGEQFVLGDDRRVLLGLADAGGSRRPGESISSASQPSSAPISAATAGAAARLAARSNRWARVRRASTSSSVVAISWRTA